MYYIHVNRQFIAQNAKDGKERPVYTVKEGKAGKPRYGREVIVDGPSRMVYSGEQLKCGARAWIETEGPIRIVDETNWYEVRNV